MVFFLRVRDIFRQRVTASSPRNFHSEGLGGFPNLLTMLEVGMQTAKYFSPRILDHGETRKCTMFLANEV